MKKPKRRLWMRLKAHGGEIPVFVQRDKLVDDEGVECDALYEPTKGLIVVRQYPNVDYMKAKLHHEIMHVCLENHTADVQERLFGPVEKDRTENEEVFIGIMEPTQYDLLTRNGFLRYPNPPRVK
jgi:hypothetical protein